MHRDINTQSFFVSCVVPSLGGLTHIVLLEQLLITDFS